MQEQRSDIVADGAQRLREAKNYSEMRRVMLAEVVQRYEKERQGASIWRRIWIDFRIHREVAAELKKHFPPSALHVAPLPK